MALLRGVIDLLFPPACQVCRTPGPDALCRTCVDRFHLIRPPVCDRCGRPLHGPPDLVFTCKQCRHRRLYFHRARAVGTYDGTLRDAVHALKFAGRATVAEPLGRLMAAVATTLSVDPKTIVVPVPLHPDRQRQRGFNQAELLARPVAAAVDRPLIPRALQRVRATQAQVGLPATDRRQNVRLAFVAGRFPDTACALLIDDVFSTGSTVNECARALRAAGVCRVDVLTLAHTVFE